MGYTPYYTAGVWGGCDENQKMYGKNGGTSFHKDIWRKIMTRVHEGLTDPGFPVPDSVETAQICRKSGKLAVSGVCSADPRGNAVYTEYFAKGTTPTDYCNTHVRVTVCETTGLLPGVNCPKSTQIRIALPADASGATDDSPFAIPSATCPGHTDTILPPDTTIIEPGGDSSSGGSVAPIGPGYVSPENNQAPTSSGESGVSLGPGRD